MWQEVRAAMVRKGDTTPIGKVTDVDFSSGEMYIVIITIGGVEYTRSFDAPVSVER